MPDPPATPDPRRPASVEREEQTPYARWVRALASLGPHRLWLARLTFSHVEALVAVARPFEPDPFQQAVLHGLGALPTAPENLRLDPQILGRVLRELEAAGLVERQPGGLRLSPRGLEAPHTALGYERRGFSFVDNTPLQFPPSFLALSTPVESPRAREPASAGPPLPDLLEGIRECIRRPAGWKAEHGFPHEVEQVCVPSPEDWRRVVVAHGETDSFLLAEVGEQLLGFTAVPPTGVDVGAPRFALSDWEVIFPDLSPDLPPEGWRTAWQEWCRDSGVGLTAEEVGACRCEPAGGRLLVRMPVALRERIQIAEEAPRWLLVPQGPRAQALAEVVLREE